MLRYQCSGCRTVAMIGLAVVTLIRTDTSLAVSEERTALFSEALSVLCRGSRRVSQKKGPSGLCLYSGTAFTYEHLNMSVAVPDYAK